MFRLRDFNHLPELDHLMKEVNQSGPGLVIVAGLDPRGNLLSGGSDMFLPSGRSFIFDILVNDFLESFPEARAIQVTSQKGGVRPPSHLRRRLEVARTETDHPEQCVEALQKAAAKRPDLLVFDRLTPVAGQALAEALQMGLRVICQLDTVLRGAEVARQVGALPQGQSLLDGLSWVVAVRRLPVLCKHCRKTAAPTPEQIGRLCGLYPHLTPLAEEVVSNPQSMQSFRVAGSCERCRAGRLGDMAAFDVFYHDRSLPNPLLNPSRLPLEVYMLRLAAQGQLPLGDLLDLEVDQLHRTYTLLANSEHSLAETNRILHSKLAELEAAHRVLEQRTEVLMALQDINHALITSAPLTDLAGRASRRAGKLCGAERVLLYYMEQPAVNSGEKPVSAKVLSAWGWPSRLQGQPVEPSALILPAGSRSPVPYTWLPPGASPRDPFKPTAGLAVPLIAQEQQVGLMVIQTAQKPRFTPGEASLLQTLADQAALAIQRAGLVDELRAKIIQLEQAQVELVQKERLERELELARQVQQSVLPKTFPPVPRLQFSALNEPARQVGGDFYDVFIQGEGMLGLVVGDVSDKGMPAALFMALTRSLLLSEARRAVSPRQVLVNVNRLLQDLGEPNQFVSVFYGALNLETRRLVFSRAGHDRPILLRNGELHTLGGQGAVLGVLEEDELGLSEEQVDLYPGDRLVLYTDGLTDTLNPDGQFFELPRLQQLLRDVAHLPAHDLCQAVFDSLLRYQDGADQFDDMTLLVMQAD